MPIATPNRPRPALPSLVIAAIITLAAAIIALGVVGLASAQAPPAAPTNVTVLASGEGFVISWDSSDAASHWVAWMSNDDYAAARDAGDWTKALKYDHVPSGDTHVISSERLVGGKYYWIIVGSVSGASAVAWGEWHQATALQVAPEPEPTDDDLTQAYVETAIAYYDANGLDATIAHYNAPGSIEGERALYLIDAETTVFLASPIPAIRGLALTDIGPGVLLLDEVNRATEQGHFFDKLWLNVATGQQEPARFFIARQDGLVFMSAHYVVKENVADATQEYVNRAIRYYDDYGLDAMVAHYNTRASFDGQFYLFMMDENDVYLVHPFIPRLVGTDIKNVVGRDKDGNEGYELGKEIAKADENGIWVEYLWPNPETLKDENKVTWAIRHDGKIFASGYYTGREEPGLPAWATTDPREYTEQYVNQAIERYQEHGLASVEAYYNSVASFEGEFYLFATDPNDTYIIHPVFPDLIGTDIKDVARAGFELGKELAKATNEEGVWVEYQWPHPMTLADADKVAYAKRYDGYLFASGYYPLPDDPQAATRAYIQQAIDLYESDGLDAMVAHYNSRDSIVDGQWRLSVIDGNGKIIVSATLPNLVGTNAADLIAVDGTAEGLEMLQATAEGYWFSHLQPNFRGAGEMWLNSLAIRHDDGLIFVSGYHTPIPDVASEPEPTDDDALTRAYVEAAIARYDRDGREAAFTYYNSRDSLEGERALFVFEPATFIIRVTLINPAGIGIPLTNHGEATAFMKGWIAATATGEGWLEYQSANPLTGQLEPKRGFGKRHDGLIIISSHSILQENIEDTTKNYVNKAIQHYDDNGRQATIDHYNSWEDSRDGYFYLFLMDENDIYLAHPIRKDLVGTDIKNVVGRDKDGNEGYELGKEIAKADDNGIWVDYLWPNPVSGLDEAKTTWAIRHDGLIFASGYYNPLPEHIPPACLDADPREYTEDYVNRAIKRYEEDGLDAMVDRYDSVASFECNWYLFATDANDKYIVHPFKPELKGTDIKDLDPNFTDVNGNPLGTELAKAGEGQGVWVEYLWPHPATTKDARKVAYAVRKDGMIFASGYYPAPEDQPAHVQAFVQGAIDEYDRNGLDGVKNIYGQGENSGGLWFLQVLDENGVYVVHGSIPRFVGLDARTLPLPADVDGNPLVPQVLAATEDGAWLNIPWPAVNGPENLKAHLWVVKHDGHFFGAAYYDTLPYVRTAE